MIVQIDLPDATIENIIKRAARGAKPVEREIVITSADRHALEEVFQTTIADGADLAKRVRQLAAITIGGVQYLFAPDEIARLDMQATFHGVTREAFVANMVKEIAGRMLELV